MRDEDRVRPPPFTRFLFRLLLRGEDEETIWGDVEEAFEKRVAERGRVYARWWYRRQALGSVWARWMARLRRRGADRSRVGPPARRGDGILKSFVRDIRYAGRGLLRTPGQTLAAIITLGLGIGITTTEFGMLYGLFYRTLPFEDADQLVGLWRTTALSDQIRVPVHDFVEWREAQSSFTDLAADYTGMVGLRGSEEATQLNAAFVSWNALPLLGAQPSMGRSFLEEDDRFGAPLVAILSRRVWEERFGEDAAIIGQEAVINGEPATIIGVALAKV